TTRLGSTNSKYDSLAKRVGGGNGSTIVVCMMAPIEMRMPMDTAQRGRCDRKCEEFGGWRRTGTARFQNENRVGRRINRVLEGCGQPLLTIWLLKPELVDGFLLAGV